MKIKQISWLQSALNDKAPVFSGLTEETSVDNVDLFIFWDDTASDYKKIQKLNLLSGYMTASSTNTLTNKTFDANGTGNSISNLETEDFAANVIDNDTSLSADSATRLATQQAIKAYVDNSVWVSDAMVYQGAIDASTTPNYPAADKGDTYKISVAGKIGGASGVNVEVGDMIICDTDSTASGDQATVGDNWNVFQANIDWAVVTGDTSSIDETIVVQDGTTGKVYKKSSVTVADLQIGTFIKEDIASTVNSASTAFDVTTTQSRKAGCYFSVALNGETLSQSEINSFSGTTLNITVPYETDATDVITVSYYY